MGWKTWNIFSRKGTRDRHFSNPLRSALRFCAVNFLTKVRLLWTACIALFISAVVGLHWGAQISIAMLPAAQREYADPAVLHSVWITRSIFLFLLCAICGLLGIYYSLRASER